MINKIKKFIGLCVHEWIMSVKIDWICADELDVKIIETQCRHCAKLKIEKY